MVMLMAVCARALQANPGLTQMLEEDYTQLQALVSNHYGLQEYKKKTIGVDADELFTIYKEFALASSSFDDFWRRTQWIGSHLRDSHVAFYRGKRSRNCLPYSSYRIDGKPYLFRDSESGLKLLGEIVTMDGRDVGSVLNAMALRQNQSTVHDRLHTTTRQLTCHRSSLFGNRQGDSTIHVLNSGDRLMNFLGEWGEANDQLRYVSDLVSIPKTVERVSTAPMAAKWQDSRGTFGYIQIPTLMQRPIVNWPPSQDEVDRFLEPYHNALSAMQNADKVVLDLRDNRGGIDYYYCPLLKIFNQHETLACADVDTSTVSTYFDGDLVAIVNHGCRSGCEVLADIFASSHAVKLVGETTAGAGAWATIPSGGTLSHSNIEIQLSGGLIETVDGQYFENFGIRPEIPLRLRVDDLLDGQWSFLGEALRLSGPTARQITNRLIPIRKRSKLPSAIREKVSSKDVIVVGEVHGSVEIPEFFTGLMRLFRNQKMLIGLEIPNTEQIFVDRFLASGDDADLQESMFFGKSSDHDGRSSKAMVDILRFIRELSRARVICFDSSHSAEVSRDYRMAQKILQEIAVHDPQKTIVLTGNIHSRLRKGAPWDASFKSMALNLLEMGVNQHKLMSIKARYQSGQIWACIGQSCGIQNLLDVQSNYVQAMPQNYLFIEDGVVDGHNATFYAKRLTYSPPAFHD